MLFYCLALMKLSAMILREGGAAAAEAKRRRCRMQPREAQPLVHMKRTFTSAAVVARKYQSSMSNAFWYKACTDAVARQMGNLPIALGALLVSCVPVLQKCCAAFYTH
jgi:hypothetical protein